VERLKCILILIGCLWSSQGLLAGVGEPKPVYPALYTSVYEQKVLLQALQGNKDDALQLLLSNAPEMDLTKEKAVRKELADFLKKLQQKQKRYSDKLFLEQFYYAVHRKFLKSYQPYQNFYALVNEGKYNCLSGTALYGYLLQELGYTFRLYETDYHTFLMVNTAEGEEILIESTDPLYGFVEGREQVAEKLAQIKKDVLSNASAEERPYHDFKLNVLRQVNLAQLAGLQYFNQAAALYNSRKAKKAEIALSKGRLLYQAERFDYFAELLVSQ
jgi:hypothetical protein